ncbi:MAG: hypothetical protein ACI9V1_003303 [Spirosomataceae bacterium]|jgi:uncharacterized protein YecT (DUF1311 family)
MRTIVFLSLLVSVASFGQKHARVTSTDLKFTDSNFQNCLDKGENMMGCTSSYYDQIDKLLNLSYFSLYDALPQGKRTVLKSEQRAWLAYRDSFFEYNSRGFNEIEEGREGKMFILEANAVFVKSRVKLLISRMDSLSDY